MSQGSGLLAHVGRAEGHVQEARKAWDPTSVDACTKCSQALRMAVAEMEAACRAAAEGPAAPEAQPRLARLRGDVHVLARLVDAAMAFCRGLELRTHTEELASSEVKG